MESARRSRGRGRGGGVGAPRPGPARGGGVAGLLILVVVACCEIWLRFPGGYGIITLGGKSNRRGKIGPVRSDSERYHASCGGRGSEKK